ncbi:SusD/RagB family nutrient-binding outer membrane lipoprotein [Niabella beijingensis]|uniref:SusD/RagB family nutrient-binding outer membrane lipoprotein n=1 Tax=Niabella beijingensis TaxID=2872700 RepID=UPI001CBFBF44|nr:SusD/RagB family nutrient-binding outer membrane lipoprotein [Niabella beijingensis]MBZ4188569.1 SusD/RagB family nutrient-binding outer membrane lipoprotein [Niabella beijingensis]
MKKVIRYILLIPAASLIFTGCTKFSDDFNTSPNQPTKASNPQLLTYAITQLQYTLETPYSVLYAQQLSDKIYTDNSRYTTTNFDFYWIYSGPLINLEAILKSDIKNDENGSEANQYAVARILKAYYFWYATDRWGDIPYSEALKGEDKFTYKYDSQKDIYDALFKELKAAAAQIDNGKGVTGDILYNGEMENWRRFANSIRLLMALRLSKVDAERGKAEFTDALSSGVFTDNDQSAVYRHLPESTNENYWYNVFDVLNRKWYCISEPLVNYMKPLGDPRLKTFADPTASNGEYVGMPYGLEANAAGNIQAANVSFLGAKMRQQDAPSYLVTYPEVLFAIAEAAKTGWIPGGNAEAGNNYKLAVENSVKQWNNNDETGLSTFMNQPSVKYSSAGALKQIGYQKWVHLYLNGYEAWAEWRRTGYPVLSPAPDNNNIPIPRRQGYPTKEPNINSVNYKAAVAAQPGLNGKDDLTGRVWWDKP